MAKVLVVLDGGYRFADAGGITDFTYTTLVNALVSAGHQVTKAHLETDTSADMDNVDLGTMNLIAFDVIWLIGFTGRNTSNATDPPSGAGISSQAVRKIAEFMDAGGGVFATGDHDSIGAELSGHIPRVRAMRCWYGPGDTASPMPSTFPRNFFPTGSGRFDTTQRNPLGNYDRDSDGTDDGIIWFQNQSDSIPRPITPTTTPAHPILRHAGNDVRVYPDHMHEGNTLGEVPSYDYTQTVTVDGYDVVEFPEVAGQRELPRVIATGEAVTPLLDSGNNPVGYPIYYANDPSGSSLDTNATSPKTNGTLSVYDGRVAGVGRIVTGATFHHYVDINLSGDTGINTATELARTGPDAAKTQGFNYPGAAATRAAINAVYNNITNWLARPAARIQIILERSTFSQAEATATPNFASAALVVIDGVKPEQFPDGGITTLAPSDQQLADWAPSFDFLPASGLALVPTGVSSDDPTLPDRLQRITFTYELRTTGTTFGFAGATSTVRATATLSNPAVFATDVTDFAFIQLVKSANPFMLDLANNNETPWLSSDLRVFHVVAGGAPGPTGTALVANANRAQALAYLENVLSTMTVAQFESLPTAQEAAVLSALPTTTGTNRRVYNFAVARVRLSAAGAAAADVRVFFRIFRSQTTAALTYNESPPGTPIDGYRKTPGATPVALPGVNSASTEWLSFPMFAATRTSPMTQSDPLNVKQVDPGVDKFFFALVDNNLTDAYLPVTPGAMSSPLNLPDLLYGEHQCIVAQIEYGGTPIPSGVTPFTSDKLAQRNLALSSIANPGLEASRVALHTFEIEATPGVTADELLLHWPGEPPDRTEVRLYIPSWSAAAVVELADKIYPRHDISVIDAQTIAVPGGGTRYVPIPTSALRQTGVITLHLPLGVKKGQRFDLSIRQVTTRARRFTADLPKQQRLSIAEAASLIERAGVKVPPEDRTGSKKKNRQLPRGVFNVGKNQVLVTDLRALDADGEGAILLEYPAPATVAKARQAAGQWRETLGAFQIGVPVSVKADMLGHYLRLLSVMRWRAEFLPRSSRWYKTFTRYVELLADKVRALGGDPWMVPPTQDGAISLPGSAAGDDGGQGTPGGAGDTPYFEPGDDAWLSETTGLDAPASALPNVHSGKVSGLLHDHFGDFEGFTLEDYAGGQRRFFSREASVHVIVRSAMVDRSVLTVVTVSSSSRRVRRVLLRPPVR